MTYKKKFFIALLVLLIFLCVSTVTANENITEEISSDSNLEKFAVEKSYDDIPLNSSDDNDVVISSENDGNRLNSGVDKKDDVVDNTNNQNSVSTSTPVITFIKTELTREDWQGIEVKISEKERPNYIYPNALVKYCIVDYGQSPNPNYYYETTTDSNGIFNIMAGSCWEVGKYTAYVEFYNIKANQTITVKKVPLRVYAPSVIKVDSKHDFVLKANVDFSYIESGVLAQIIIDGKTYIREVDENHCICLKLNLPIKKTYEYSITIIDNHFESNTAKGRIIVGDFKVKVFAVKSISLIGQKSLLKAVIIDGYGKKINEGIVKFKINGKSYNVKVKNGVAIKKIKLPKIKTYKYKAIYSSKYSKSATSTSKVVVMKYNVKISTKSYKNYKGQKSVLKAIVKNYGEEISYGKVKFTINGKTYKTKVEDGVATKKIKLASGEYKYKAVFVLKNYKSKASKSKIIVKNTPTFTVKNGKYSVKLSYKEYKKLKNKDKRYYMKWTGQYKYETRKHTYHKKVCYAEVDYSYDWSDSSWEYHKDKYRYKNDWKWYGSSYSSYNDGHYVKYFNKYKKTVKKTVKRKVYMTVNYHNGLHSTVWTKA